jgi:hypothetical protein
MQTTRPREFIALIAFLTALMAMSIDTMLPAIGQWQPSSARPIQMTGN